MNPADNLPIRDIHLPDPVSWWPPAPGWWLLLVLIGILLFAAYKLIKKIRQPVLKKSAKAEIESVIGAYNAHRNKLLLMQDLSIALRRIGISYLPRNAMAGLAGSDWYRQLNTLVAKDRLADDTIQLLSDLPYQKKPEVNDQQIDALIQQIHKWVAALSRERADA